MFEYFYNEILRSTIISFGSLFNGIEIKHKDGNDETWSVVKVPLAYGPTQKFLARLEQTPDLNTPVQITLPRISFEFIDLTYDPERKVSKSQTFVITGDNGEQTKKAYMPVPYNMVFELSVMTKLNDDMLQITEQILPYFTPAYTIPVKLLSGLTEVVNTPVVLDNVSMEDDYEGNFDTRRALVYTFRFTAKTYLYGPLTDISSSIVEKVSVGYIAGTRTKGKTQHERDVTYTVEPRALKDYNGSEVAQLTANVSFEDTVIEVSDGTKFTKKSYIYMGEEQMYVDNIVDDKLTVRRAQDKTPIQQHVLGSAIYNITKADASFIEVGDNFGFDGGFS